MRDRNQPSVILELLRASHSWRSISPTWLGAPGGFVEQLPQTDVKFDSDEIECMDLPCSGSPTSGSSLLCNLNRIRRWLHPAKWFMPRATEPPSMHIYVEPGIAYWGGTTGSPIVWLGGTSGSFVHNSGSDPRIDILFFNRDTGALGIEQGTPAPSPVPPWPLLGNPLPIAETYMRPCSGSIFNPCSSGSGLNNYIYQDVRPFITAGFEALGFLYYFHNVASDIAGYMEMCSEITVAVEGTSAAIGKNVDGDILIEEFVTPTSCPGVTLISAGIWLSHIYATINSDTGDSYLKVVLYKRTAGGVETELWAKQDSHQLSGAEVAIYGLEKSDPDDHGLGATDRLVLKVYFNTTAAANKTVTIYYDGANDHLSHLHSPIVTGAVGVAGAGGGGWAVPYLFSADTTDPPVAGDIELNNAAWAAATEIYVSETDKNAVDVEAWTDDIRPGDLFTVWKNSSPEVFGQYMVKTVTDSGTYATLTVRHIRSSVATFSDNNDIWALVDSSVPIMENVVTVAKSGGDYDDIQDALDAIVDATSSKRYVILIGPDYEGFHRNIVLKSYVDLMGLGTYNQVDGAHSFYLTAASPVDVSVFNLALVSISNVSAVKLTGGNVDFHNCRLVTKDSADYEYAPTVSLPGGTHRFFNCDLINNASGSAVRGGPALLAGGVPSDTVVDLYGCYLESDGSNAGCHGIYCSGDGVVNVHQGTTIIANGGKALYQTIGGVINVYSAEYDPDDTAGTITGADKDFVVGDLTVIDDLVLNGISHGDAEPFDAHATNPSCRLNHDAAQSIPDNTETILDFNLEEFDTGGWHESVINPDRLTADVNMKLLVGAQIRWASNANGSRYLTIIHNFVGGGSQNVMRDRRAPTAAGTTDQSGTTLILMEAGDYVTVTAWQDSGGALNCNASAGAHPILWGTRVA